VVLVGSGMEYCYLACYGRFGQRCHQI